MNNQDLDSLLNQITNSYVRDRENVALTIGVVQQEHLYIKGFGRFSAMDNSLPNAQTIYEIGSVTKVFTGAILSQLVNDEIVKLHDPIHLYLPAEVVTKLPPVIQSITLCQLATHTSGLPRLPDSFLEIITDMNNPYVDYKAQEMYAALGELTLLSEPGQRYEYSNFGMGLLGHLLSLKTTQPYEELVKEIICRPLGIKNTTIYLTPQQRQHLTLGHSPDGALSVNWDFDVMAPAGGLCSTVADLLIFLQAHLYPVNSSVGAMLGRLQECYFTSENLSMGLAWHIYTLPTGQVMHWHNGGTGGYVSFIGFNKILQTGIVMLSNYGDTLVDDYSVDDMAAKIFMEISSS